MRSPPVSYDTPLEAGCRGRAGEAMQGKALGARCLPVTRRKDRAARGRGQCAPLRAATQGLLTGALVEPSLFAARMAEGAMGLRFRRSVRFVTDRPNGAIPGSP